MNIFRIIVLAWLSSASSTFAFSREFNQSVDTLEKYFFENCGDAGCLVDVRKDSLLYRRAISATGMVFNTLDSTLGSMTESNVDSFSRAFRVASEAAWNLRTNSPYNEMGNFDEALADSFKKVQPPEVGRLIAHEYRILLRFRARELQANYGVPASDAAKFVWADWHRGSRNLAERKKAGQYLDEFMEKGLPVSRLYYLYADFYCCKNPDGLRLESSFRKNRKFIMENCYLGDIMAYLSTMFQYIGKTKNAKDPFVLEVTNALLESKKPDLKNPKDIDVVQAAYLDMLYQPTFKNDVRYMAFVKQFTSKIGAGKGEIEQRFHDDKLRADFFLGGE